MAKITEQAIAEIRINDTQAADRLTNLSQKAKQLKGDLDAAGDSFSKRKDIQKQLKETEREMQRVYAQSVNVKQILDDINGTSLSRLEAAQKKLNAQFRDGAIELKDYQRQIQPINKRIEELRGVMRSTDTVQQSFFQRMQAGFKKNIVAIGAYTAALTGLAKIAKKVIDANAKMDDALADVRKTTGLTTDQVNSLNESLMALDTRTSQEQLLNLAETAGRLGITGEKDVLGFVRAADQINVALGDSLGEGAIRDLGKLNDLFKQTEKLGIEKALLATGSALNSLGMASTANEGAIVDFTRRLAGISTQAEISIQDTLGLGAALDSLGQTAEVSSTAVGKVILDMFKNTSRFAKAAGMDVKSFTDLLKTDANEALLTVLENIQKKGGLSELAPIFADLGAEGSRAVNVLATLASNIETVRKQQAIANEEFAKATSVTEEFTTKNTTLAAEIEKIGKNIQTWLISSGVTKALTSVAQSIAEITTPAESAAVQFDNMKNKVVELDKEVTPLIDRFEELHGKFGRTGKEQEELEDIMRRFGNVIPGMTTAFTEEGVATDALVARINQYIAAKRKQYEALSTSAIDEATEKLKQNITEIDRLEKKVRGDRTVDVASSYADFALGTGNVDYRQLTDKEKTQLEARLRDLYATQTQLETDLQTLRRSGYDEMLRQQSQEKTAIDETVETVEKKIAAYDDAIKIVEENYEKERLLLTQQRERGELDQATYNAKLLVAEEMFLQTKLQLQKSYGESTVKTEQTIAENRIKIMEKLTPKDSGDEYLKKLQADSDKMFEKILSDSAKELEAQADLVEKALDQDIELRMEKYQEWMQLRQHLGIVGFAEQYRVEKARIDDLHASEIISEEEHQQAMLALRLQYAEEYANRAGQFASGLNAVVTGLEDLALSKSRARKNKELALAGDNAEKRAEIENRYAKEEIDIQKRYADANFALQVAQITSSTAVAAMNAFSAMAGIPIVGPVLGGIAAAAAIAAGAIQIAQAKQARDQAKSITLAGGTSGGSRITSAGGYASGGYTGAGPSDEPAGVVHRDEYVVPSVVMRNPAAIDHVRVLEAMRQSYYPARRRSPGFLEGGYTDDAPSSSSPTSPSSPLQETEQSAQTNRDLVNVLSILSEEVATLNRKGAWVSYERGEKARSDANDVKFRATRKR